MRIVFMGTPDFAVPSLEMLIKEGYEIAAVVTQPDRPKGRGNKLCPPPVKEYALKMGIPVKQPEKVKTPEFTDWLKGMKPELLVTAAYGRILSQDILDTPPLGCINVHASLLPKYRGAAPIQWAVINGEKVTGITTMYTDIGMDTGDILVKRELEIPEYLTFGELHDLLAPLGAETLRETLKQLRDGTLERTPQNSAEATHAPMIDKETGRIDWSRSSNQIHNLVRGTNPWPVSYSFYKGERIKVWKTAVTTKDETGNSIGFNYSDARPGSILNVTKGGMLVRTADGAINILEVQFDNCRKMGICECGHNMDEGEKLG